MKRLLIADAHAVFCELIASRIAMAQQTFREIRWIARHDALESQLAEGSPDLILLGTNLSPNGISDPLQVIRQASLRVKKSIAVLVLDDKLMHGNLSIALDFKTHGYCLKTSSFEEIDESLTQITRGAQAFCPEASAFLELTSEGVAYRQEAIGAPFHALSPREYQTLILMANGRTTAQCASILGVKDSTVDNYKWRLMRKLNIRRSVDITLLAYREGLLT